MPRAAGKRYGPIHLGYLTSVCALKKVLSVRDMGILIAAGEARDKTPEELYQYFCAALDRALTDTASSIDPAAQREDLARMALDLALRSYSAQLACARLLLYCLEQGVDLGRYLRQYDMERIATLRRR